jgi:iron complex transport system substrate-binding protein
VIFGALAAGVALGFAVHGCGERLAARSAGRFAGPAASRVALFSPAAVEIAFALGAGPRVVGVTRYAVRPPEARRLPDIGGFTDMNLERLAVLKPDLIVTQGTSEPLARFCESRGIRLLVLRIETVADVLAACRELGRRIGAVARGERLAARIGAELDGVRRSVAGLPKVPCFLSVDRSPGSLRGLLTAGRDTFLTELADAAGGRNVFADMGQLYPIVSKEALLARAPEVVVELKPGAAASEEAALAADWSGMAGLPAVAKNRIAVVARQDALLPGIGLGGLARTLAAILHPEAVAHDR